MNFSSISDHPGASKIELPCRRESNFTHCAPLVLSSLLGSILDPKKSTKSSPRCSNIQSKTSFEKPCRYGFDFEVNLASTWTQLGLMLAPKIHQKSILEPWAPPKAPLGPLDARFWLIFVRFSNNFQTFFYQSGILFFMNVYLTALVDSYPEMAQYAFRG